MMASNLQLHTIPRSRQFVIPESGQLLFMTKYTGPLNPVITNINLPDVSLLLRMIQRKYYNKTTWLGNVGKANIPNNMYGRDSQ